MLIWNILYCQKKVPLNYISTYSHTNIPKIVAMLNDTNLHYLKAAVLQDVILYSLFKRNRSLRAGCSETSIHIHQSTRLHIPEHKFQ